MCLDVCRKQRVCMYVCVKGCTTHYALALVMVQPKEPHYIAPRVMREVEEGVQEGVGGCWGHTGHSLCLLARSEY